MPCRKLPDGVHRSAIPNQRERKIQSCENTCNEKRAENCKLRIKLTNILDLLLRDNDKIFHQLFRIRLTRNGEFLKRHCFFALKPEQKQNNENTDAFHSEMETF